MIRNEHLLETKNKCMISYELLALLVHLMDYEEKGLIALIKRAVSNGLTEEVLHNKSLTPEELLQEAQLTVLDFFDTMEFHMLRAMQDVSATKDSAKNILPAIEQLDTATFDFEATRLSMKKGKIATGNAKKSAREDLCRELLRGWSPYKNEVVN